MRLPSHAVSGCPPINVAPYGRGSFPFLSPLLGCHPAQLGTAPRRCRGSIPSRCHSPWEKGDVPPRSRSLHGGKCYLLWAGKGGRLVLITSAGKASKAGSKVSVASQDQSGRAWLMAESSPVRIVTPKHQSSIPVNLSPWTLQLRFYLPYLFPLNSMSSERERNSTGKKRRISRKGVWVRTRESGGGLSKGSKGGLLHSQLVELGQLLRGRRDIRAKKVIVIEYNKSHQKSRTKL